MELKRIEQYWQADSDADKPNKFTKNLNAQHPEALKGFLARQT